MRNKQVGKKIDWLKTKNRKISSEQTIEPFRPIQSFHLFVLHPAGARRHEERTNGWRRQQHNQTDRLTNQTIGRPFDGHVCAVFRFGLSSRAEDANLPWSYLHWVLSTLFISADLSHALAKTLIACRKLGKKKVSNTRGAKRADFRKFSHGSKWLLWKRWSKVRWKERWTDGWKSKCSWEEEIFRNNKKFSSRRNIAVMSVNF